MKTKTILALAFAGLFAVTASADVTHTVLLNRVFIIPLNRLTFWGTPIFLLIWNNLSA